MCPETAMAKSTPSLERELATYQRLLPTLTPGNEGRYALIAGDELLGTYDTYPDALAAGYQARGLEPFLVKKISSVEVISYFTRDLRPSCHTSLTK